MTKFFPPTRFGFYGFDDVYVSCAAAQIGRQEIDDFLVVEVWVLFERAHGEHQEARRAEAAL